MLGERPVIDHWWQTETGWPIAANCLGIERLPVKPGSPTRPVPGYDVRILRGDGSEAAPGEEGAIAIRLPLPPGTLPTLWDDDDRYRAGYLSAFPGHYLTGDGGFIDADGYLFVMGRIDDVINVAGHRLSTGAIEEVVAAHPDVAECAVIGVPDELQGPGAARPRGAEGRRRARPRRAARELVAMVRDQIGAVACFRDSRVVDRLPEDAVGQDPAGDDARDRRGPRRDGAVDDRGSGRPGRDRRRAGAARAPRVLTAPRGRPP